MLVYRSILLSLLMLYLPAVNAAILENGDFSTCNFAGWERDTDGAGVIASGNDFSINGTAPSCEAVISVDYTDTEAFFANTLFQFLDFSSAGSGPLTLSMDIEVNSELTDTDNNFVADYFIISFYDGVDTYDNTGPNQRLFEADINGLASYTLSFLLDASLTSLPNLSLDFQLLLGADDDGFTDLGGSTLRVNNVSITENSVSVPEPSGAILMIVGLAAAFGARVSREKQLSGQRS